MDSGGSRGDHIMSVNDGIGVRWVLPHAKQLDMEVDRDALVVPLLLHLRSSEGPSC